jgi:hypothetical protein
MSTWTVERARLASLSRSREPNDPDLLAARRDLAAERLAEHIKRTVDAAPPLTVEQRERLTLLLHPRAREGANTQTTPKRSSIASGGVPLAG